MCIYSERRTLTNKNVHAMIYRHTCTSREAERNFCQQLVFVLLFLSQSCCIHHCYQHSLTALLSALSLIWQLGDCYRFPFYPVLFSPFGCFLLIIMIFSATLEGSIMTAAKKNANGFPWWCLKRGEEKGNKTGGKNAKLSKFPLNLFIHFLHEDVLDFHKAWFWNYHFKEGKLCNIT